MITARTSGENTNRRSESDLDRRYGQIAISALVAALPYRGDAKNEAHARPETQEDHAG